MNSKHINQWHSILCLFCMLIYGVGTWAASELPLLTEDTSAPILYRIKNTRRTSKGAANYWTTTGLSTSQDSATQVYFTGTRNNGVLCVKIHLKDSDKTLTDEFVWGEGTDWYIKQFTTVQGGTDVTTGSKYKGVLISNASSFPDVYNDKRADDGLGCWYVGSSNTSVWLYGGQWDGSIFTMEIVDPSFLPGSNPTTQGYIVNPSFETGDLTGWVFGNIGGEHFVKPISDEVFATSGGEGDYIFNSWYSSDNYVATTQNQSVYQTIKNLPAGEYRLTAKVASNSKNNVCLFANNFAYEAVPGHKGSFDEFELSGIYVTPETRSLTLGLRSASWFRADDFQLVSLGETSAYNKYVEEAYVNASIAKPILLDAFDGQQTDGFTVEKATESGKGTFPYNAAMQNDRTMADRSKLQYWTASSTALGNSIVHVNYTDLPNGYYRISSHVRVYDQYGTYNNPATGLEMFANEESLSISKGNPISSGTLSGKGFSGDYNVITKVEDGILDAGFRVNKASFNWLAWQNFCVEYVGTNNPGDDVLKLDFPAGQYAALCLPYTIKPAYFGQTYTVAEISQGKAVLIPVESVAAGMPCVVMATGENNVTVSDVDFDFTKPTGYLTLWNNALLQGDYDSHTWKASLVDGSEVNGDNLTYTVADLSSLTFTATQENYAAAAFWEQNKSYSANSTSVIEKYLNYPTYGRRDQPNPIIIPVVKRATSQKLTYSTYSDFSDAKTLTVAGNTSFVELYNLMPGLTYYYKTADGLSAGKFTVGGTLRMIQVGNNAYNVRDLGGKKTVDGKFVKYGKLFRSGEFNGGYVATSEELQVMRDMGIGAEIDLRNFDNGGVGTSPFGYTINEGNYYCVGGDHYVGDGPNTINDIEAKSHWKNEFEMIVNNLREFRGVDFHCRIGADRTGMLAFLLEGILGVSEADLLRDYETTSFSTAAGTRTKSNYGYDNMIKNTFKNKIPSGGTLRDAFNTYFIKELGVKQETIDEFRSLMLSENAHDDAEMIAMLSSISNLRSAIADARKYKIGESVSEYSCSNEQVLAAYNSALAEAEKYIHSLQFDKTMTTTHTNAVKKATTSLVSSLKLNMPKSGIYVYLKSASYGSYISCASSSDDKGYIRFPMVAQSDKNCVFYYDGCHLVNNETKLTFSTDPIEYGNGIGDRSNMTAVSPDIASDISIKASSSKTIGAYNLYTSNAVLLTKRAGNNLDGFNSWLQHTDEDVIMEEVKDVHTVIGELAEPSSTNHAVYDLSGRQVCAPKRGLYIRSGKLVNMH